MIINLSLLGGSSVPARTGELRLFGVMRNEAQRVPFFLKYYSERGVDRFFIVDNDSTDGTTELLLAKENVHVFHTVQSYSESGCGIEWLENLLASYGENHWCVIADADELLVYPGWEQLSLPRLCRYLELEQVSALPAILVDMYSDRPFDETEYVPGTDPLAICPFYESDTILCMGSLQQEQAGTWRHVGGMRQRLFSVTVCLDKISLIKYNPAMKLQAGMHGIGYARVSKMRGAVLHFKYLSDFATRVAIEANRMEHWGNAIEYKRYAEVTGCGERLCAYGSISRRFSASTDLIESGIMRCPEEFVQYLSTRQGSSRTDETVSQHVSPTGLVPNI